MSRCRPISDHTDEDQAPAPLWPLCPACSEPLVDSLYGLTGKVIGTCPSCDWAFDSVASNLADD